MEGFVADGKAKGIGVSNFTQEQLQVVQERLSWPLFYSVFHCFELF